MYAPIQRKIHALMAVLIFVMIPLGLVLPNLPEGPRAAFFYEMHKSIGILLLILLPLRFLSRMILGAPDDPAQIDPRLYRLAKIAHAMLYGLMLFVPIAGLVATASCCAPVAFLGLLPLPLSLEVSEAVTKFLFLLHERGAWILGLAIIVHVGMALWHRRKDDGVFDRMWSR